MTALKPCPFCGGEGKIKEAVVPTSRGGHVRGWVGCPDCGAYIQWTYEPKKAIEKWNTRPAEKEEDK